MLNHHHRKNQRQQVDEQKKKKKKIFGDGNNYQCDDERNFLSLLNVCFRWEEEQYTDGRKWTTLEHKGPLFPPAYESLPNHVKFFYNGSLIFIEKFSLTLSMIE